MVGIEVLPKKSTSDGEWVWMLSDLLSNGKYIHIEVNYYSKKVNKS